MTRRLNASARRRVPTAVLAVGLFGLAACGSGESSTDASPNAPDSESGATGGEEVVMRLIAYKPKTLEVSAGSTVTWTQQDAGFHTVTSGTVTTDASGSVKPDPDGTFDSGQLAKGKEFTHAFDDAGTYQYFCEIHPATMSGEVTVQ